MRRDLQVELNNFFQRKKLLLLLLNLIVFSSIETRGIKIVPKQMKMKIFSEQKDENDLALRTMLIISMR